VRHVIFLLILKDIPASFVELSSLALISSSHLSASSPPREHTTESRPRSDCQNN